MHTILNLCVFSAQVSLFTYYDSVVYRLIVVAYGFIPRTYYNNIIVYRGLGTPAARSGTLWSRLRRKNIRTRDGRIIRICGAVCVAASRPYSRMFRACVRRVTTEINNIYSGEKMARKRDKE